MTVSSCSSSDLSGGRCHDILTFLFGTRKSSPFGSLLAQYWLRVFFYYRTSCRVTTAKLKTINWNEFKVAIISFLLLLLSIQLPTVQFVSLSCWLHDNQQSQSLLPLTHSSHSSSPYSERNTDGLCILQKAKVTKAPLGHTREERVTETIHCSRQARPLLEA